MTLNKMNAVERHKATPNSLARLVVDAVSTVAALEQRAAVAVHTVDTHMKITELIAEAEIAQDRIDYGRRFR